MDLAKAPFCGAENKPLIILDAARAAGLRSFCPTTPACGRGYEGCGPYVDLLRRLAHWLMKEPDLEEETLSARAGRHEITIDRRTVKGEVGEATMTTPSAR